MPVYEQLGNGKTFCKYNIIQAIRKPKNLVPVANWKIFFSFLYIQQLVIAYSFKVYIQHDPKGIGTQKRQSNIMIHACNYFAKERTNIGSVDMTSLSIKVSVQGIVSTIYCCSPAEINLGIMII